MKEQHKNNQQQPSTKISSSNSDIQRTTIDEDKITAIAKRGIKLLEENLEKEFGVRVRMGAELEFLVDKKLLSDIGIKRTDIGAYLRGKFKPANLFIDKLKENIEYIKGEIDASNIPTDNIADSAILDDIEDICRLSPKTKYSNIDFSVLTSRLAKFTTSIEGYVEREVISRMRETSGILGALEHTPYFIHSPYISSVYKELDNGKYELVFTHESEHNSPLVLARAVDAGKKVLKKGAENMDTVKNVEFPALHKNKWFGVYPLLFEKITTSMQINFSLESSTTGKNLFEFKGNDERERVDNIIKIIRQNVKNVGKEAILSLAENDDFYDRIKYKNERNYPYGVERRPYDDRNSNNYYIENCIARAQSNPYCAVLATMAGIYNAVAYDNRLSVNDGNIELRTNDIGENFDYSLKTLPESKKEAIQSFTNGEILFRVLNDISGDEKLGEQFKNAVLAKSVETEKTINR